MQLLQFFGAGVMAGAAAVAALRCSLRERNPEPARRPIRTARKPQIDWQVGSADALAPAAAAGLPAPATEHACYALAQPARRASLRIGVLGPVTINGQPGGLLPAQTQLIVALAVHGAAGLPGRRLQVLLGSDAQHPKPADSLRQLIARTRRRLGKASDGNAWIMHIGHGHYAVHQDARLDMREFDELADDGIASGDAVSLASALAMIRGQPFAGCFYWWLDFELIDAVSAKIVAAAGTLAELMLTRHEPATAARAVRVGLVADAASEELWRLLMRSEHAAGNLAGVREAWSRCAEVAAEVAADGKPEPATTDLFHQLLDH